MKTLLFMNPLNVRLFLYTEGYFYFYFPVLFVAVSLACLTWAFVLSFIMLYLSVYVIWKLFKVFGPNHHSSKRCKISNKVQNGPKAGIKRLVWPQDSCLLVWLVILALCHSLLRQVREWNPQQKLWTLWWLPSFLLLSC